MIIVLFIRIRLTEEIDFFRGRFGRNHTAMLSKYSEDFRYDFHPAGSVVFSQGSRKMSLDYM